MFDTKEVILGGDTYTVKKFPTIEGMKIRRELYAFHQEGMGVPPVEFQIKVICGGATVNSIQIDQKKFESQFRGKFDIMDQLFTEILDFNFNLNGDEGKDQSATAE
jgi:hypothetical protein